MKKGKIIILSWLVVGGLLYNCNLSNAGSCLKYLGHGYCTDYIKYRTGFPHSGNAGTWSGNISAQQIRVGDVAIFEPTKTNPYGHVAVIEKVDGDYITISEWNYGKKTGDKEKDACGVTQLFHKLHIPYRVVPISSVTRFWRPANDYSNNPDGSQTWYLGQHAHVIHNDYRCSTEMPNGKNLCWEPGLDPNEPDGRRNCWNASKWYEVTGDVGRVWINRTKSDHIIFRDRSMCAEVYNDHSGMGGPGYTDDSGTSNPWAGYAHDVGLKYMKIGKKSSSHWSGSKTWTEGEIPSKRDFRIKLKQKGGVWPDEACAEVWFSHNKHFTDEDLFLKRKCKDLSDETADEKSIYVKDVHLPTMEAGEDYYFFTVVTYSGGANPSSEGDHDEYVKVEIVDNPIGDNSSNNQTSWDNLPEATKTAIMSIILN